MAFVLRVSVPCNCRARIVLPDGTVHLVVAGRHEFRLPRDGLQEAADGIPVLREVSEAS